MEDSIDDLIRRCRQAIARGRWQVAAGFCRDILTRDPAVAEGHYLAGLVAGQQGRLQVAGRAFTEALARDPAHAGARVQLARVRVSQGRFAEAVAEAERAAGDVVRDPLLQDVLGTVYSQVGLQERALPLLQQAAAARPDSPRFHTNLAACLGFLGERDAAAAALGRACALARGRELARCHWQLAMLQRARDSTHIATMAGLLEAPAPDPQSAAYYAYAMGKEYEDLEDWEAAWRCFERGAAAAGRLHAWDAAGDDAMFAALRQGLDARWLQRHQASAGQGRGRLFIVGLPRTGTTLLEQVLAAHSQVATAGELQQLPLVLKRLSGVRSPAQLDAAIVTAGARLDMNQLGAAYLDAIRFLPVDAPLVIDKLPHNFLYLGFIAAALPAARIIHLRRDPLDACFAIYKQLFAGAYTFSYSLDAIARYYTAYHRLMQHWRDLLGPRLIEVRYEELATDLEETAGTALAALGLALEPACLEFHRSGGPVATASASQVREPVHTRSVGRWRRYARQLESLRRQLEEAGIDATGGR